MNADQACKECRRRKAKCNRGLPTCSLCIRYRRHCLYEKHSRTPLTRKHLTEVEERLERAEALLARFRLSQTRQSPSLSDSVHQHDIPAAFSFSSPETPFPGSSDLFIPPLTNFQQADASNFLDSSESHVLMDQLPQHDSSSAQAANRPSNCEAYEEPSAPTVEDPTSSSMLECPPVNDFEWDERPAPFSQLLDQESPSWASKSSEDGEIEENIIDGMASLTVDDREAGYLGVASGAALLRIIDPLPESRKKLTNLRNRLDRFSSGSRTMTTPLLEQPNPNRQILDSMIDSYFRVYHLNYPIVHEPMFRAQYSEVIPRPNGDCWLILAYVVAAIGVFTTATSSSDNTDLDIFAQAKLLFSINLLEVGNLTLVQALTLISNYQQKRNMPNSGYNYLGLAQRMAMGLGLHKEFQGRRVWWLLCVFDVGATITFSRPMTWPWKGSEVALPMNISDKELTASSRSYPAEVAEITPYTAVRTQAVFHRNTNQIYTRVISKPLSTAKELLDLDDTLIGDWLSKLPSHFKEQSSVSPKYAFAHAVMSWRYRNLRIIMYRPFVIRKALYRNGQKDDSAESNKAYERCLDEAKSSIHAISQFWKVNEHTRVAACALIPCICLRNSPLSQHAPDWRSQVRITLDTIYSLSSINSSSPRCYQVILKLCRPFLQHNDSEEDMGGTIRGPGLEDHDGHGLGMSPINESPQTQMSSVYPMMWPNINEYEADVIMQDDAWMEFLRGENPDLGNLGS
ncbi:uncharacterized protein LY89DRAFT_700957 [Mollisia scopiformis]|uniref:Zn(2)-C6 fungal-type domain-containing protein n=1 Tax=Mollisia scopiformis TaxID=149040 RepID=A0A132BDS9_MOLSC|nr:uncharacterized protein LY89DRAFT_700957 [Mollisia scopiformis]KUJ10575.1 hypothetical protein LY89DRAFT_700957 [Mollisia scopiformis]